MVYKSQEGSMINHDFHIMIFFLLYHTLVQTSHTEKKEHL